MDRFCATTFIVVSVLMEGGNGAGNVTGGAERGTGKLCKTRLRILLIDCYVNGTAVSVSAFQIVRFPNKPCTRSSSPNMTGTCYKATECSSKGGRSDGSCAKGYGVCCAFILNCGGSSIENNTYVQSGFPTTGACIYTICPCNSNICQLRLDFNTFVIAGPSTNSNAETLIVDGAPLVGGVSSTFASRCLTDSFVVTNSGGTNPPIVCGTNTGEHMYVDVDRSNTNGCNRLVFILGQDAIFTNIPTRQWTIVVSQISCDSLVKAPSGCTQYYTSPAGTVQTYNFIGGQHLAFQRQTICVRRARGSCRICWTAIVASDFEVSGTNVGGITKSKVCCGGGGGTVKGVASKNVGYDCVQIPGALRRTRGGASAIFSTAMLAASRFCGRDAGLVTLGLGSAAQTSRTVCSTVTPFYIRFISDGYELPKEVNAKGGNNMNKGFRLMYTQDANQCK